LARTTSSGWTRLGIAASCAGRYPAFSVAIAKITASTDQTDSWCVAYRRAIDPISSPRHALAAIMNRLRSVRSIRAPMNSPNSRNGRYVRALAAAR